MLARFVCLFICCLMLQAAIFQLYEDGLLIIESDDNSTDDEHIIKSVATLLENWIHN